MVMVGEDLAKAVKQCAKQLEDVPEESSRQDLLRFSEELKTPCRVFGKEK